MPWSTKFDDPIVPPDGSKPMRTLRDAGRYITGLAAAKQNRPEWQTAAEILMLAAEGKNPVMFAQIAMARALHAGRATERPERRKKRAKKYRIIR